MIIKANLLTVKETQYIFPPRAKDCIKLEDAAIFADMGWIGQLKYNDARCLIKFKRGGDIELWNRHGERFRNYTAPGWLIEQLEVVHQKLGLSKDEWSLLDGGLLDFKHCAIRDTIAIWDVLVLDGQHLLGSTYIDRYDLIRERLCGGVTQETTWWYYNPKPTVHPPLDFGIKVTDNVLIPRNYLGDAWQRIWQEIIEVANAPYTVGKPGDKNYSLHPVVEGLVMKDPSGKLEMGFREQNNSKWQVRSRVATGRHAF